MKKYYTLTEVADMLSVSKETLRRWDRSGKLTAIRHPMNNYRVYKKEQLLQFEKLGFIFNPKANNKIKPKKTYSVIELFAGAGGLAIGLEKAGLKCLLLNDIDKWACQTLKKNRSKWNVVNGDIKDISFKKYRRKVDVITGGFPCQAFSYAGKKLGFKDTRGTLFFEYARAVKEAQPILCIAENVRGLLKHDNERTIKGIISVLDELGYRILEPRLLKALFYRVPQKRERTIIVGIRNDISIDYEFPHPHNMVYNLRDALQKGRLYRRDVPKSDGVEYPKRKKRNNEACSSRWVLERPAN